MNSVMKSLLGVIGFLLLFPGLCGTIIYVIGLPDLYNDIRPRHSITELSAAAPVIATFSIQFGCLGAFLAYKYLPLPNLAKMLRPLGILSLISYLIFSAWFASEAQTWLPYLLILLALQIVPIIFTLPALLTKEPKP